MSATPPTPRKADEAAVQEPLFVLPSVGGRRIRGSIAEFERSCLVHIERLQGSINDYDDAMLDTFCEAVRLSREYADSVYPPPTKQKDE